MKRILLFITILLIFLPARAVGKEEAAIRNILFTQVGEWNHGHIEGHMKGYWESDSLVFIGKNGPTYGYAATLARYRKSYPDAVAMGQLTSTVISMRRLSKHYYFVTGSWALQRSKGDVSGSWTLLFRKIKGAWVIVVDHSS